jgi:hypothetical protein
MGALTDAGYQGNPWGRPPQGAGSTDRIHRLLTQRPLPPLVTVLKEIFEDILGQKISQAGPNLALADRLITNAEKGGRPILFVLHDEHDDYMADEQWLRMRTLVAPCGISLRGVLQDYVEIVMPLKQMPALSQRLGRPPFEAPNGATPLFVIARSDGEQLTAVTGWYSHSALARALAYGWVDALKRNPPKYRQLRTITRFVSRIDSRLGDELKELLNEVRSKSKQTEANDQEATLAGSYDVFDTKRG